ncbi:MAG: hypothetical protein H6607_02425 [Flavobacteriales bacterium]|nr:hypothetical protein [Flavobacteriales bacterium]
MKTKLLLTIIVFLSNCLFGFSQTIDQIKKASDEHNAPKKTPKSSEDGNSSDYYEEPPQTQVEEEEEEEESVSDNNYYVYRQRTPRPPRPPRIKYSDTAQNYKPNGGSVAFRYTLDNRNLSIGVLEAKFHIGALQLRIRENMLTEFHPDKTDHYNTLDLQLFGFQTRSNEPFGIAAGIGVMNEQYSGKAYFEMTEEIRMDFTPKLGFEICGRQAFNKGVTVRVEWNSSVNVLLLKKPRYKVKLNGIYNLATYYETVDYTSFLCGLTMSL